MADFGIGFQSLTQRIFVGRLNKDRNAFVEKSDVTNPAVAAVAEYVLAQYPEGMVLRTGDGSGWEIDVKRIPGEVA